MTNATNRVSLMAK